MNNKVNPEAYEINFACEERADSGSCMVYGHPRSIINCTEKDKTIKEEKCGGIMENNDLIKLWKNNESRRDFLNAYSEWGVWLTTKELDLNYYRYQLPDGTTIIAMEHMHKAYVGYQQGYTWETSVRYYVQTQDEPFTPNSHNSITAVAELLKAAKVQLQSRTKKKD